MLPRPTMHPNRKTKNLSGLAVDDDSGVTAAVLLLLLVAVFPHVHDDLGPDPMLSSIRAATQADVNVALQIARRAAP